MVWLGLTLIDEKERRVHPAVSGTDWIFDTLSDDPRSIDEFIEVEKAHSSYSVFDKIDDYSVHPPDSRVGERRGPDFGGTIIADLRSRIVTVKGYLARSLDEIPHDTPAVCEGRRIVHPRTAEPYFEIYGLLSELFSGEACYRRKVQRKKLAKNSFDGLAKVVSEPQAPSQENPRLVWMPERGAYPDERGQVESVLTASWTTPYRMPSSWKIKDGITHAIYVQS